MIGKQLFVGTPLPGLLVLCWVLVVPVGGNEVVETVSLDDVSHLGTRISLDASNKTEGKGSVRIETSWPTTICLAEIPGLAIEGCKLLYQAKVKSVLTEGTAYLEMWCQVGGGHYFSRGLNSTVEGSTSWKTLETPFFLQAGQTAQKVTLNLAIQGKGTVWIDEVTLVRAPLE